MLQPESKTQKNFHIWLAITLIPLFIFVAPPIPALHDNAIWLVFALAVIFVFLSLIAGALFDACLAGFIAMVFLVSRFLFADVPQPILVLRTASILAFVLLNAVLLIGPWSRFSARVRGWYRFRRHLGVTVFLLSELHFSFVFHDYFNYSPNLMHLAFFTFFGTTGLLIFWALALTSWDYLQRTVTQKQWKNIHLGLFLVYLALVAYTVSNNVLRGFSLEPYQYVVIAFFLALWIAVAPWGLAHRFVKFMDGWKQLHVLVHIAFASLVLHVWLVIVQIAPWWIKATFIGLVALTWGSHIGGWIIKWKEDRRLKMQAAQSKFIQIDGKPYWSLDRVETFQEGKGRKFLVNNLPIAIFKYQEKFFGLFAFCAHQKGPIEHGKIVNGYVECPWHHRRFSCSDGSGSARASDRLAFYPCIVQDGMVYVSALPKRIEAKQE